MYKEDDFDVDEETIGKFVLERFIRIYIGIDLIKTVQAEELEQIKQLAGISVDINYEDSLENTALHIVSSTELVRFLVENGANINLRNDMGDTALLIAEQSSSPTIEEIK